MNCPHKEHGIRASQPGSRVRGPVGSSARFFPPVRALGLGSLGLSAARAAQPNAAYGHREDAAAADPGSRA
eukprot:CAMPEP_0197932432 /NCGR_PEP_ID=MMETSP1439-20131203/108589_1 /TAXON_ID=66791 /ORGANISM="Gonyaulax spinifera, Strain CCMP409" /LENGTH=70 /DNA_ID=CAMNT_0043555215 /DNA_START=18 /DNA_END=227 /DNA_ORIENTATION=+